MYGGAPNTVDRRRVQHWASKIKVDFAKEFEQKHIPLELSDGEFARQELEELLAFFGMDSCQVRENASHRRALGIADCWSASPAPERSGEGEGAAGACQAVLRVSSSAATTTPEPWSPRRPRQAQQATSPCKASLKLAPICRARFSSGDDIDDRPTSSSSVSIGLSQGPGRSPRRRVNAQLVLANEALAAIEGICDEPAEERRRRAERTRQPFTPRELAQASLPEAVVVPPIFLRTGNRQGASHYDYFTRKIPTESPEHRRLMSWRTEMARKVYKYNVQPGTTPRSAATSDASPFGVGCGASVGADERRGSSGLGNPRLGSPRLGSPRFASPSGSR